MKPTKGNWNPLFDYNEGEILYFAMPDAFYVGAVASVEMDDLGFVYAVFSGPVWQVIEKQAKGGVENRGPVTGEFDVMDGGPICISGIPGLKIGRAADLWPVWKEKPWSSVTAI